MRIFLWLCLVAIVFALDETVVYPKRIDGLILNSIKQPCEKSLSIEITESTDLLMVLRLELSEDLKQNRTLIEYHNGLDAQSKIQTKLSNREICFYNGYVENQTFSFLSVSFLNGKMTGIINLDNVIYKIEPVNSEWLSNTSTSPHFLSKGLDPYLATGTMNLRSGHGITKKRNTKLDYTIRTLIVADRTMADFYRNDYLEVYIMTIMNMVSQLYKNISMDLNVNFVIVRIVILENDDEFKSSSDADDTLRKFGVYQHRLNLESTHYNHHDIGVLITRTNLCSKSSCNTLGLAHTGSLCEPLKNCNINEDNGLSLAYTVAHEIAHNLNAPHDESEDGSNTNMYVMNAQFSSSGEKLIWSNTSSQLIATFLKERATCLTDDVAILEIQDENILPGFVYDFEHQCRLYFGQNSTLCKSNQVTCTIVWCRLQNDCVMKPNYAFDGTLCNDYKSHWCIDGKCVPAERTEEKLKPQGWSKWSDWSRCSRTCGGGLQKRLRKCYIDMNSEADNSVLCNGTAVEYRICNQKKCQEPDQTEIDRRIKNIQCKKYNLDEIALEWEYFQSANSPCRLTCRSVANKSLTYELNVFLDDGTSCAPDTNDMCINGECTPVGCDWKIGSQAKLDECGVCNGDNSSCLIVNGVKDLSNRSLSYSRYYKVLYLPVGASNIVIHDNTRNYLALQDVNGTFYVNGALKIEANFKRRINNMFLTYQRNGTLESILIDGPTSVEIIVMVIYQFDKPLINYSYMLKKHDQIFFPENSTEEYYWDYTGWSECSVSCGEGHRRRLVNCFKRDYGLVADVMCSNVEHIEDIEEPCNLQSCKANWWVSEWEACSTNCKNGRKGWRTRKIFCVKNSDITKNESETIVVPYSQCNHLTPLPQVEQCKGTQFCSDANHWVYDEWRQTCNGDVCVEERRNVRCSDFNGVCDMSSMPSRKRECKSKLCERPPKYKCHQPNTTSHANALKVNLKLNCEKNNEICLNMLLRFLKNKLSNCSTASKAIAVSGEVLDKIDENVWLADSITDNDVIIDSNTTINKRSVFEVLLNQTQKIQELSYERNFLYDWKHGAFGQCSKSCGKGYKIRTVTCKSIHENQIVPDMFCIKTKPKTFELCNTKKCLKTKQNTTTRDYKSIVDCSSGGKCMKTRMAKNDTCTKDIFATNICQKIFLSNGCYNSYFHTKCCVTCVRLY